MAETETSAETETDVEEETLAWAAQTPTTRIKGTPTELIFAGPIDGSTEQTGNSYGVIFEDVEVVEGELWENQVKPSDGTTEDVTEEGNSRPTDYRFADHTHDRANTVEVGDETLLTTGENGPSSYEQTDTVEHDRVIVWYNGLTGQRIGRVLDFNGRPFARWVDNEDGSYLIKGLYQAAEGWRDASGSERSDLAKNGKAPRVARAPILRNRVETEYDDEGNIESVDLTDEADGTEILVDMSDAPSGRGYRAHVFDADAFEDEFGSLDAELPRNDAGYVDDEIESELEMPYHPRADEVLEQAEYSMQMYGGDGWQSEPSDWTPQSTSEVDSFGVSAADGSDGEESTDDGFTATQEQFIEEVVDEVKGSGLTPDEAFEGGLEGLIGKHSSNFDRVPEADDIRGAVYERVSHLSTDDLQ